MCIYDIFCLMLVCIICVLSKDDVVVIHLHYVLLALAMNGWKCICAALSLCWMYNTNVSKC